MRPYIVKQGDYLEKIAHALGFDADTVWADGKNAELKQKRDPNLLHPGDILYVPDAKPTWLPLQAGTTNQYVADVPKTHLKLTFSNAGAPRANEPYVVKGLGAAVDGTSGGDGTIEIDVPVHVREIQIVFPKAKIAYPVQIGDMDPIDETAGVRKRLQHLGFEPSWADPGPPEEVMLAADRLALLSFQRVNGLETTGVADDATKKALVAAHGS